jgi:hypothetical protein
MWLMRRCRYGGGDYNVCGRLKKFFFCRPRPLFRPLIRLWFASVSPLEANHGIRITVESSTSDPDLFRRFGGVNAPTMPSGVCGLRSGVSGL